MGLVILGVALMFWSAFSFFGGGVAFAAIMIVVGFGTALAGALKIATRDDRC